MTILDDFLRKNLLEEQSSLILFSIETLSKLGFVDIEFNIDELASMLETIDLFELTQCCYTYIRKVQNMAFESLELKVDNEEDISTANDILISLDLLEDSKMSYLITEIIDSSDNPEDAFISLLEQVLFQDTTSILAVLQYVPSSLIERLYNVHKGELDLIRFTGKAVEEIDKRKMDLLNHAWRLREINTLKNHILTNELNLPIPKELFLSLKAEEIKRFRTSKDKKRCAVKLLEGCLVMDVEWKDIKTQMKQLANEIFNDLLFTTELSYDIDNICMEYDINGAF